jgi:hypothetical protein
VRDNCPDVESHCLIEPSAEIDMAVSFGAHAISQIASVCAEKWQEEKLVLKFGLKALNCVDFRTFFAVKRM